MSNPTPPPHDAPPAGLARRSLGALKWNYLGTGVMVLSQLVIGIVLARLLGPEVFGLVAIAWLVLGLGMLIANSGLGVALIQKPQVSARDIRYVFTLQMFAGAALALSGFVFAPLIADFFFRPDATSILRWMSAMFLLQAFGQAATALLRRDLNHKRVQLIQVISYLFAYLLLGLPLAYAGFGVWSLVIAQLTQTTLQSAAAYLSVRHALMPALRADQPGLLVFGTKVLGSNLTSWGISYFDSVIVGRMLGMVELGLYNRSMNLLASPMNAAVSSLQGVLLPLYSRLQQQRARARDIYLATLCLVSALLAPAFSAIAAMPQTTVLAIFGQDWQAASVLIAPLALAMPVNAALALGGPMMQGLGHAGMEAVSQGIGLAVLVVAVILAANHSLAAVAWAVLGVYLLRAWLVTRLAAGLVGIPAGSILRALAGPLFLATLGGLSGFALDTALANRFDQPGVRLTLALGLSALIVLAVLLAGGRWLFCREAQTLFNQARPHLPARLHPVMRYWSRA